MAFSERELVARYQAVFFTVDTPVIVRSPGRVNIIGEHTDYNDGFVLPAAIDLAAYVAVQRRGDKIIRLYAEAYDAYVETTVSQLKRSQDHWSNYVLGVADQLIRTGIDLPGFNLYLTGDIPIGAGLSSSAAVECATLFALDTLFQLGLTRAEMVHLAQRAEHSFVGVHCGVMDMFASLFGKQGQVLKLDCRSLLYEYIPFALEGYRILLLNTNVRHTLSTSAYNTRRQECDQGLRWVQAQHPEVRALRDVTADMLEAIVLPRDPLIYQRCLYVVEENRRVAQACAYLRAGDLISLGRKMYETHAGLRHAYEVSCRELDMLVDFMREETAVIGARMMGGGFGGCTINIVRAADLEDLVMRVMDAYQKNTGLSLSPYVASIEDGTQCMTAVSKVQALSQVPDPATIHS